MVLSEMLFITLVDILVPIDIPVFLRTCVTEPPVKQLYISVLTRSSVTSHYPQANLKNYFTIYSMNSSKLEFPKIKEEDRTPLVDVLLELLAWQQKQIDKLEQEILKLKGETTKPKIG